MNTDTKSLKNLTLLSVAGYLFILALAAKAVFFYMDLHPPKEELLSTEGIVRKVRLGGEGKSTSFLIESEGKTSRYSSYYGKVWPGMERINKGDRIHVLAERKKLDKTEIISGKAYYIWELVHQNQVIVAYEDIYKLVKGIESTVHRYANGILIACAVFLFIAYIRKEFILQKK